MASLMQTTYSKTFCEWNDYTFTPMSAKFDSVGLIDNNSALTPMLALHQTDTRPAITWNKYDKVLWLNIESSVHN